MQAQFTAGTAGFIGFLFGAIAGLLLALKLYKRERDKDRKTTQALIILAKAGRLEEVLKRRVEAKRHGRDTKGLRGRAGDGHEAGPEGGPELSLPVAAEEG